jgi:threonine dehydrogenase-like Zn-dependent dehydrogenase
MSGLRRIAVVDGEGTVSVVEEDVPEPGDGEVLIDVEASLITPGSGASTVGERREDPDQSRQDLKRGYQGAGVVSTTGDGVATFDPGDRVACMGGRYAYHADAVVVPQNLVVPLPEGVSFEEGAFNHLAATGLHAVRRGDVQVGEFVSVVGLGLVGRLTGQIAGIAGARVAGVDRLAGRVEAALEGGFDHAVAASETDSVEAVRDFTDGRGIDCGFVCFGGDGTQAFEQLIGMTKEAPDGHRYGRIVVVGIARIDHEYPLDLGNMDVRASSRPGPGYHDQEWERGADYATTYRGDLEWTTRRNMAASLRLIDEGDLDVASLITHRFPLSAVEAGYDALLESPGETLGVVIEP